MIQFTLKCDNDHRFDSWFQSSCAFEKLKASGLVTCTICGSADVKKAIMAPRVRDSRKHAPARPDTPDRPLGRASSPAETALAELKRKVEADSEYVGLGFAQEARDIHDGLAPERPIYGEAKPEDAARLLEDGVPVTPLPFVPGRKTN